MNTGTYSSAKEKSDEIAAILRDISLLIGQERGLAENLETGGNVVSGLGFISNAQALAVRAQDIQQGIFKIIVLGEFKHGKSTLLNAMLGGRVLAARATPCTAIVTMLVNGDSSNVSVYETGKDSPKIMSLEAFTSEYQLTREDQETLNKQGYINRFQNIDYAQIECQHSLCANGVRLIDSPGLKESSSRTKVTNRFLQQAQAIIFVLNATQIISEDERRFVSENLGKGRLTNVFFVVNKINLVDEFEVDDIKKYVKLGIEDCFIDEEGDFDQDLYDRRVFYVDAKGALAARSGQETNQAQLEVSGLLPLEQELEAFLASNEKVSAYFESSIQSLSWIVPEVHKNVRRRKTTLDEPLVDLEQRSKEAEQRLESLESRKSTMDRAIQFYISKIIGKAASSLKDHVATMRRTWKEESEKQISLDEIFGLNLESLRNFANLINIFDQESKRLAIQKINQAIEREVKKYSEPKFKEWSEQVPDLLESDFQSMIQELKLQTEAFELELEKIKDFFFGIHAEAQDTLNLEQNTEAKIWQSYIGLMMFDFSQITGTLLGKGDWTSFFKRAMLQVGTGLAVNFIFPVIGSLAFIVFLALEAVIIYIQREDFKAKVLEEIGKNFFNGLDEKMPEICQSLESEIQEKLTKMTSPLIDKLRSEIDEFRQSKDKVIAQKQQMTFSAEKEKARLDAIETKLTHITQKSKKVSGSAIPSKIAAKP
ncbi:MAG: dynamin family protein [Pseudanabaena sp. M165S2SP1A06QC]|nr:dynamin family protein [Pseudanabaena sp. M165S2SP1A06QC]